MKAILSIVGLTALTFLTSQVTSGLIGDSNYIADVNGKKITSSDFSEYFNQYKFIKKADFKTEKAEIKYNDSRKQVMNNLISRNILFNEAKERNIVVADSEVDFEVDKIVKENFNGIYQNFEKELNKRYFSLDHFKSLIRIGLTRNKLRDSLFNEKPKLTDDELEKIYQERIKEFTIPISADAFHILVKEEKLANDIYQKLKKGEDYSDLAKKYSIDPRSKDTNGYLGKVPKGQAYDAFDKGLFSLKSGEYSKPVKTAFGYHIIKKTTEYPEEVKPFSDVKDQLKSSIDESEKKKILYRWEVESLKNANIKYNNKYKNFAVKTEEEINNG